jgi:hypothetical protein
MEGSGRGLIYDTVPTFACGDFAEQRKTSVTIAAARDEILTRDLPSVMTQHGRKVGLRKIYTEV